MVYFDAVYCIVYSTLPHHVLLQDVNTMSFVPHHEKFQFHTILKENLTTSSEYDWNFPSHTDHVCTIASLLCLPTVSLSS